MGLVFMFLDFFWKLIDVKVLIEIIFLYLFINMDLNLELQDKTIKMKLIGFLSWQY